MSWLHYHLHRPALAQYAHQVPVLELLCPLPLILVGVLRILDPFVVGVVIALGLLPWIVRWFVSGRPTRPAFTSGALMLLASSGLLGVWVSYDPNLSWPLFFNLLGSIALFFAIVNTHVLPQQVTKGLIVAAALVACYFVAQYGHFNYPFETGRLANVGRITGSLLPDLVFFTPQPNAVANFLEGTVLLGLVLAWQARNGKRLTWGLITALIAYGLLISGSRGAWLGLVVAGAIWGLWSIPNRNLRLGVAGVGIILAILATVVIIWLNQSSGPIPAVASIINTAASRFTLYRNSLYLWSDYPFTGIGLGNTFALVYSRYQLLLNAPFLTYSHNIFLSVALGQGILGLVALIWLLISFYTFVIRTERAGLSPTYWPLFRAAWLGVTVTFVHGLTDSPQFAGTGWAMPMLFGLLGVTVVSGRPALAENNDREVKRKSPALHQRAGLLAAGAVALVIGVAVFEFWPLLLSAWYVNLGALHQTRAELSPNLDETTRKVAITQAIVYFERALGLNPAQPVANRRLGMIALTWDKPDLAIYYLEKAYQQEPHNQATLKALGYVYLWNGRLDEAEPLLQRLDDQDELIEELGNWGNWWEAQERMVMSKYARDMAQRLLNRP